jgi:hypothetical protein
MYWFDHFDIDILYDKCCLPAKSSSFDINILYHKCCLPANSSSFDINILYDKCCLPANLSSFFVIFRRIMVTPEKLYNLKQMNKNEYQFILVLFSFFKHFKNYYFNKILYKNCITSPTTRDVKKTEVPSYHRHFKRISIKINRKYYHQSKSQYKY